MEAAPPADQASVNPYRFCGPLEDAQGRVVAIVTGRVPGAAGLAAVPFALWHTVLALAETPSRNPTHLALQFAGYLPGGVGLGVLRPATRTLAAPLAAHWALNATLMLPLHPLGQRLARGSLVRGATLGSSEAKRARGHHTLLGAGVPEPDVARASSRASSR